MATLCLLLVRKMDTINKRINEEKNQGLSNSRLLIQIKSGLITNWFFFPGASVILFAFFEVCVIMKWWYPHFYSTKRFTRVKVCTSSSLVLHLNNLLLLPLAVLQCYASMVELFIELPNELVLKWSNSSL